MLLLLAIVLGALWLLGYGVWHVASFAVHLLLLAAVVMIAVHFIRAARRGGRPRAV